MERRRNIYTWIVCVIGLLLVGCGHGGTERTFPKLLNIETLKTTIFVPEISIPAPDSLNIIYSPTVLFAWDELKVKMGSPLKLINAVHDLDVINNSTSFKGSLLKGEYESQVTIDESSGETNIRAHFQKSLPFAEKMNTSAEPFLFLGTPVKAFGMPYYDDKITKAVHLLYYESDNKFIIVITPNDTMQELVLAMGFNGAGSLEKVLLEVDKLITHGVSQSCELGTSDQLLIPVIKFNLQKEFGEYVHTSIMAGNTVHTLENLSQRTAFLMDEYGAKVESEAYVSTDSVGAPVTNIQRPKSLLFNKPFVVLLRKKGVAHPYLMVKVSNAELMVKR